ncbi:hypothetical protein [Rhodopirellula bahusiensis]|uniref:hypothetical protein n=1 Tax=Rhodopirellula bahusiensis TaxID=2014065 RepID=UPI003263FACC
MIVFGSPLYRDPSKAGWNFTEGVVPLDGSIDYEKSPFTTTSKFPDGTEVTWITLDPEWGEDKPHEDAVQHFVKLYLERQNASLVRLTPVASKALVFSPRQFTEPESINSEAVGVVSVSYSATRPKPSGNNVSVPTPGASIVSSGPERSLEAVIREGETNPDTTVIAVTWTSDDPTADVDLWVSTSGEEGELYFGNPVTDWGILYRDVQRTEDNRGGDDIRRWEYLTISHRDLDRVTLWLNAFKTNKPIEARIVRIFDGVRKERTVTLKTNEGDGGANRFHRARSAAWARVNLQTFKATDAPGGI